MKVEIVKEYEKWRRIRDEEGKEGWVYKQIIQGKRKEIKEKWMKKEKGKIIEMRREEEEKEGVNEEVEKGVVGKVRE